MADKINENKKISKKKTGVIVGVCAAAICACVIGSQCMKGSDANKYTSQVSDPDSAVISGDAKATKQELYEYLMDSDNGAGTASVTFAKVIEKDYPYKKYKQEIDSYIKDSEKQIKTGYKSINRYLKISGYKNKDELEKKALIPAARMQLVRQEYTKKNYSSIKKEFNAAWIEVASYKSEKDAREAMSKVNKAKYKKKAFESLNTSVKKSTGSDATTPYNYGLTGSFIQLPGGLSKYLSEFSAMKKDGLYSKVIKQDKTYSIVYVYNTKENKTTKASGEAILAQSLPADYFFRTVLKKHNIKVYDPKVEKQLKKLKYIE